MKIIFAALSLFLVVTFPTKAQEFTSSLYETYEKYKEPSLDKRRIKYSQLLPLIKKLKANSKFEVNKVGESIEARDLNLISFGKGGTDIFLWSQMHGDEPTATQAIFDILNFFNSEDFRRERMIILANTRLHFLPMLNPDGAEVFQRRNALGIDINRDALRLQSPEGRTLKKVRDSIDPPFGFNLHDQSRYYNAERTSKPATVSYLAPAFNYRKDINEVRSRGMQVIVYMNDIIQKYAPGQIGRYSDAFEPRAFGDNLMKWGTSSILIESGGYAADREKQEIRKLNYVSILSALYGIATGEYKDIALDRYEGIPRNDRKLFDFKMENVIYGINGKDYIVDLGIQRQEIDDTFHNDFHFKSVIVDQGDLSTYYGYETFDAAGYKIVPPKATEQAIPGMSDFDRLLDYEKWVQAGFGYLRTQSIPRNKEHLLAGINLISKTYKLPDFQLKVGKNPTFFLEKEGKITHAVINGFLLDLSRPFQDQNFGNALIYR
ncbi:MAG: M14 family zinc carboxypeptidase [Bacteroidota bacterium]